MCERLDGTGDLIFLNTDGSEQRRVAKSYSALYDSNASEAYLGFNKSQWGTNSGPDVLGNALISRSSPGDPSCASCPPCSDHLCIIAHISLTTPDHGTWRLVASAVPPMRYDGGYDAKDPAHGGRGAQAGSHTFVGSRASSVWAVFDTYGTSPSGMGTPNMKCARRSFVGCGAVELTLALALRSQLQLTLVLFCLAQPVPRQIRSQHRGVQAEDRPAEDRGGPSRRLAANCLLPLH